MSEKPYSERVADLVERIRNTDPEGSKIKVEDEYHSARLAAAHFGGNILGLRRSNLHEGRTPRVSADESRREFLEGLGRIDQSQLPPDRATEFQTIIEEAESGNWDNYDFVSTLNTYCGRFARKQPIFEEEEKKI